MLWLPLRRLACQGRSGALRASFSGAARALAVRSRGAFWVEISGLFGAVHYCLERRFSLRRRGSARFGAARFCSVAKVADGRS